MEYSLKMLLGLIENHYLPIVRSFIFGFWIIVKSETRNTLNFLVFLYFKKRGGAKMAEVEVIKASDGVVNRRRYEGTGLKLDRKRVAIIFEKRISILFPWKVRWHWHC